MPDIADIQLRLHSPRWGREERCLFRLEREQATFELNSKTAVCSWPDGLDPAWDGGSTGRGNPVVDILENDKIYPPTIFVEALIYAWEAWRDGKLDIDSLQREIDELCKWVDESTHRRPQTDFWRRTF